MQDDIIKSISYSQTEILQWILCLYVPEGRFDVNPTYFKGGFYKSGEIPRPVFAIDLYPQSAEVIQADCRHLPLTDGSVRSMVIDLPFLATSGKSLDAQSGNIISRRFGVCRTENDLSALYADAVTEAWRVPCPGGILVMKCQDKVSSGKQYMMHCTIHDMAMATGFRVLDLFVLLHTAGLLPNGREIRSTQENITVIFGSSKNPNERRARKWQPEEESRPPMMCCWNGIVRSHCPIPLSAAGIHPLPHP